MSRPRQVFAKRFYLLTRRCTQRQFLLRPDPVTNQVFAYCLAEAAQRFEIDVLLTVAESNHHHTVVFDRHGRVLEFLEHFHKMIARCMNARWGRWENFWAAHQPCVTELLTPGTVIEKLIYTASNPVKDQLVERAAQWPGVNGYVHLIARRPLRAKRPHFFFRESGVMPPEVELELVIPPELGSTDEVIAAVRAGVENVERLMRTQRAKTGGRVLGRRTVRQQSWKARPNSEEPRRGLRPRFAGPIDVLRTATARFREFLGAYADARERWKTGAKRVAFPPGTYWLARHAPVTLAVADLE
jgi:hypothetical protein